MEVAQEPASRDGTYFYHIEDGFHYHLNSKVEGVRYYKCVYYERGCHGRAIEDIEGFVHVSEHEHEPDMHYPDEMALRRAILARCRSMEYRSYRQIMDEECRLFNEEVVSRVTYARMRTPMRNARMSRYPPPPANLRELTRILLDPQFSVLTMSDDGRDNLYAGSVTDDDGAHHILFVSQRNLERMRTFLVLHSDGTFKTVPVGPAFASQVFAIVGVWSHHIIYLGWALMERRTEVAYTAVLRLLRHLLGPNIALRKAITDFESGEQNAWANVFEIVIQGCLWHLTRAYMQYVVEIHVLERMRAIPDVRTIIRLTLALPLLPENLIVMGYEEIVQHARRAGAYIFRIVHPFLLYIWRYWVSRPRMRSRMCVYGSAQRTNNVCECHNKILRQQVGVHPNIYAFINGLVTLEQRAHNMCNSLRDGRRVTAGRKRTSIMNDRRLNQLAQDLENAPGPREIAVFNYLRRASHLMDNMVEEALLVRGQADRPRGRGN